MEKTHWKKHFNYDYLGSYSIEQGDEPIVTIQSTGDEEVTGEKGKKEKCFTCKFDEFDKPMILNRTNCKAISTVAESPNVEDWIGVRVQLRVEPVAAFGTVTDALRVKTTKPKENPLITDDQKDEFYAKLSEADADMEKLFKMLKIESVETMRLNSFQSAMGNLDGKIRYNERNK